MTKHLSVGGEVLSVKAAMNLVALIEYDAKQMAGEFHGMNRSEKFRVNWPDEDLFAEANWRSFVAGVRAMYSERLGDPKTKPEDARKMYLALLLERAFSEGQRQMGKESDSRLQLARNTQQFVGDSFENRKIKETYGNTPNLRARALNGAAKIARVLPTL